MTGQQKKQKIIKKIKIGLILAIIFGLIAWINIHRLQNNTYANYEKAVDYGRVREDKDDVKPVICALFYADKDVENGRILTYLDHSRNYHHRKVKMIVVPKFLTEDTFEVVERLYEEIHKHNVLKNVVLIYDGEGDVVQHKTMLQDVMEIDRIKALLMTENNLQAESDVEQFLQKDGFLIVFLADLNKGIERENSDFLAQEAIYLAQRHYYRMNVFDAIDTQLAKALDKDYEKLFALSVDADDTSSVKQKYNLEKYAAKYGSLIWHYFLRNTAALKQGRPAIWPSKDQETYRLYDRATIYIQAQTFEKQIQDKSVATALVELARRVVARKNKAEDVRIYLLTEKEQIDDTLQNADEDDGFYIQYKSYKAVLLPSQRENVKDAKTLLWQKAGLPEGIKEQNIRYYKFKTVEVTNEN